MSIFRTIENITPEMALDILGASGRSPAANGPDLEIANSHVLLSAPGVPVLVDSIVIVNGYVAAGHDLLSAISYGGKEVSAWVQRENSFEAQPE